MWPHNAFVNMRTKCWPSRGGTQLQAREEDVALEDRLKGEVEIWRDGEPVGDSRHDGEPVGDSRRDGEPNHFIALPSRRSEARVFVMPQVSGWVINPNDPVNSVDFGQTTVNLGHHLENITDKP
jgi:hypothetical protein